MENKDIIKEILQKISSGEDFDSVVEEFKERLGKVSAKEIADAERELIESGTTIDEIHELCDIHAAVFETSIEEIHNMPLEKIKGHPLFVFSSENKGIKSFIENKLNKSIDDYKNKNNKIELLENLKKLSKIDIHYKRKELLLFPYLEKNNIIAPPKVMWSVDDEIRDMIKKSIEDLEIDALDFDFLDTLIDKILSMISKEDNILNPLLKENINHKDWILISEESEEIGYVFNKEIEGATLSDIRDWQKRQVKDNIISEIKSGEINLPSGFFTIEELETLLNTLPVDITFVDSNNKVRYFSENKNRVFPRTRTIIGRDVSDCHPSKSVHIVEQIVEDFRNNKKDSEIFYINKPNIFILIRYYALRNKENKYLGVLEVTEEISELRSLEGSKTLM